MFGNGALLIPLERFALDGSVPNSDTCASLTFTEDTMFAMAGLGFVDLVDDNTYRVNAITAHMEAVPSAIHGMLHL